MKKNEIAYKVFVGNLEAKKPLGRFEYSIETSGRSSMGGCRLDSSGSG